MTVGQPSPGLEQRGEEETETELHLGPLVQSVRALSSICGDTWSQGWSFTINIVLFHPSVGLLGQSSPQHTPHSTFIWRKLRYWC